MKLFQNCQSLQYKGIKKETTKERRRRQYLKMDILKEQNEMVQQRSYSVLQLDNSMDETKIQQSILNGQEQEYLELHCFLDSNKSQILSNCLKKMQKLKGLCLIFDDYSLQTFEPLTIIGESVSSLVLLQQLSIQIALQYSRDIDNYLNSISNSLSSLQILNKLELVLKILDLQGARILSQGMSQLKLSHLKLDLVFFENNNNSMILTNMLNPIKSMRTLQELDIKLGIYEETLEKCLSILATILQGLSFLTRLQIEINDKKNITNEGLQQLKKAILNLQKLQYLKLNFSCNNEKEQPLTFIFDDLLNHNCLEEIDIHHFIAWKQVQEKFSFGTEVSNQSKLRKLKLKLDNFSSSKNVFSFEKSLLNLKNLTHINLQLLQVTLGNIENLEKMISICNKLICLKLVVDTQFNNQQIKLISDSILNLKQLKKLSFKLQFMDQNSSVPVNQLFQGIFKQLVLENLKLWLRMPSEKIVNLEECFKNLQHLKKLSLKLDCCPNSPDNIKVLVSYIPFFKKLENLKLELNFEKISQNDLKDLQNSISSLKYIKFLIINIHEKNKLLFDHSSNIPILQPL